MSIWGDTLTYLNGVYTRLEISSITGIPQSTLSYVMRGLRELPQKYWEPTNALKNTAAYSNMFNMGVPSPQASLLSLQPVTNVRQTEAYVRAVADTLTDGYILRKIESDDSGLTDDQIRAKYYNEAHEKIITALRESQKPIAEWQDYLQEYEEDYL